MQSFPEREPAVAVPPPRFLRIAMFRGRGAISALIRWQTRGRYSHCAFLLADDSIIEAWQGTGVRRRWLRDWEGVDIYYIPASAQQIAAVIADAMSKIGTPYDYLGVLRFVSRRKITSQDRLFCSEFLAGVLARAGLDLFHLVDPEEVSPAWIPRSLRVHGPALNHTPLTRALRLRPAFKMVGIDL